VSGEQSFTDLEIIEAPWGKTVTVQETTYEGGMKMLRLRIKEGKRFTDLELDSGTLARLTKTFQDWLNDNSD